MTLQHLSISSLGTLDRCELQWFYRYVEGKKIAPDGALVKGKSYHKAHETNFSQKIETKEDLPKDQVTQAFSDAFDADIQNAELKEDEDAGELKDSGVLLVQLFHEKKAPSVNPISVEASHEITVADFPFQSRLDLITAENAVVDLKTSLVSPAENVAALSPQLTAYDLTFRRVYHHSPKSLDLNFAISTKTPQIKDFSSSPRSEEQLKLFEEEVATKLERIKLGLFTPAPMMVGNRENYVCTQRFCGFYNLCPYGQKRHGG